MQSDIFEISADCFDDFDGFVREFNRMFVTRLGR
jgi:hypothetical protein